MPPTNISASTCSFILDIYQDSWKIHVVELVALALNLVSLSANLFVLFLLATTSSFHVHLRAALAQVALAQSVYFSAKATQQCFNLANYVVSYATVGKDGNEESICASLGEPLMWPVLM